MAGKHRKPGPLTITVRTTGGLVAGAVVIGTAAATAQAAVGAPGGVPAQAKPPAAAAAMNVNAAPTKSQKTPASHDVPQQMSGKAESASAKPASPTPKAEPKAPTAAQAIKLAESQVGTSEDDNGETKFADWYSSTGRAKETVERDGGSIGEYKDAAWCSMFISWIGDKLGFNDQMGFDAWTVAHAKWFEEQGRWGDKPKPGAIVFYNWGGSKSVDDIEHVGMVVKDNGDGTIKTVEGNTDDSVMDRERSEDQVVGYGYPDYAK